LLLLATIEANTAYQKILNLVIHHPACNNLFKFVDDKMRMVEEREQQEENTTQQLGKADKVMKEMQEIKYKMKDIEQEKTSLHFTVSTIKNIILVFVHVLLNSCSYPEGGGRFA